jgi:hypothetical protein
MSCQLPRAGAPASGVWCTTNASSNLRARSQAVSVHQIRPLAAQPSCGFAGIVGLAIHGSMASLESKWVVGALAQHKLSHSVY